MPVPTRLELARVLARVPSVCVTAVFVADAMLVIEEHGPDRYGADDECEHRSEAYAGGGGLGVGVRHTLNGGDVQEDPAAKGEQRRCAAPSVKFETTYPSPGSTCFESPHLGASATPVR